MRILVRDAIKTDFSAIHALNRGSLGYEYDPGLTRKAVANILEKPGNKIFVAEMDGRVIGYAHAADYDCTYCEPLKNLMAIAVDKAARGFGAGRKLLEAVESWAKQTGACGVRLVSGFERQGAHKFYLACGYMLRKEAKNFIKRF